MAAGHTRWVVYRSDEADEEYRALSPKRKSEVKRVLKSLAEGLSTTEHKELEDYPGVYRVHVPGRWRLLFTVESDARRIQVFRIRPRRTAYIGYERRPSR